MAKVIRIKHQQTTKLTEGETVYSLTVLEERITTKELICRSVREHVRKLGVGGYFDRSDKSLSQLYLTQTDINSMVSEGKIALSKNIKRIDYHSENFLSLAENKALRAFNSGRLTIFVKGRQLIDLDEDLDFEDQTKVVFLRLIPLQGG